MGLGVGGTSTSVCTGLLADTTFTWGVCAQGYATFGSLAYIDAFNSALGAYADGGLGGGFGSNAAFSANNPVTVTGSLWSTTGILQFNSPTQSTIGQDLMSGGAIPLSGGGAVNLSVGGNAYVNGNVVGGGVFNIAGQLTQPSGDTQSGVTFGSLATAPVNVANPCQAGAGIPVQNIVQYAAANDNNATVTPAISTTLLASGAPSRLDLPCGNFYFTSGGATPPATGAAAINVTSPLTIVSHGNTAIYVWGDIVVNNTLEITLDPGTSLDVFVSGTMTVNGSVIFGNPNYPASMRVYFGGGTNGTAITDGGAMTGTLNVNSPMYIAADMWAGDMYVNFNTPATFYGALYAGDVSASNPFVLHYDRASISQSQNCPLPDAGSPPPSCSTCADCDNQACVGGTCQPTACTSNSQCCPPLVCSAGGNCVLPVGP
jgi:hypothetical protein